MSSGSNWYESYLNPLSVTTESYYGSDLYKTATGVKIVKEPGTYHSYKSGDTELLGLILEKATGRSISAYASEKLWQPLGAEHPAKWSTDKKSGNEKARSEERRVGKTRRRRWTQCTQQKKKMRE